jgi:hypothetical protein
MNREYTRTLLAGMADGLRKAGFKRRGQLFERSVGDVVHLVQLQKSRSSSADALRATVNLAIWVPALAPIRAGIRDAPSEPGAQWRERLGFTMPQRRDLWWDVRSEAEAEQVAADIAASLQSYGLPRLDAVRSSEELENLWRKGLGPGLTEHQRRRFLEQLVACRGAGGAA